MSFDGEHRSVVYGLLTGILGGTSVEDGWRESS